jgi:predicted dehydrogenase
MPHLKVDNLAQSCICRRRALPAGPSRLQILGATCLKTGPLWWADVYRANSHTANGESVHAAAERGSYQAEVREFQRALEGRPTELPSGRDGFGAMRVTAAGVQCLKPSRAAQP